MTITSNGPQGIPVSKLCQNRKNPPEIGDQNCQLPKNDAIGKVTRPPVIEQCYYERFLAFSGDLEKICTDSGSIDSEIAKTRDALVKAKVKYDAIAKNLKELMEKKREHQANVIMDSFIKSGKSYKEIMNFLNIDGK